MSLKTLNILYRTPQFVAIDKPSGLLVHPTQLASYEVDSCMGRLRDQLGAWVYPVHRLDRATSGVLLFGLSAESAEKLAALYRAREVRKTYLAVVRGHTSPTGEIDAPLRKNFENKASPRVEARTRFRRLATAEVKHAVGRYSSARYSLLEVEPETGRRHQIRRHLVHLSHPVIGDTVHGDGRHNRLFRDQFAIHRLLLHAKALHFDDPFSGNRIEIVSESTNDFMLLIRNIFVV